MYDPILWNNDYNAFIIRYEHTSRIYLEQMDLLWNFCVFALILNEWRKQPKWNEMNGSVLTCFLFHRKCQFILMNLVKWVLPSLGRSSSQNRYHSQLVNNREKSILQQIQNRNIAPTSGMAISNHIINRSPYPISVLSSKSSRSRQNSSGNNSLQDDSSNHIFLHSETESIFDEDDFHAGDLANSTTVS